MEVRLQKFIADSGIASRRKAEELIKEGRVKVNGNIVTTMGVKVRLDDIIEVDDDTINIEKTKRYLMLNKPSGYITSANDQFKRPTVYEFLKDIKERVFPVGRLDYNTSGLLLLTSDGDFSYKITHPKNKIKKVYIAKLSGMPDKKDIEKFKTGIEIEGRMTSHAGFEIISADKKTSTAKITIHEGRNRQVRKMCDAIGHTIIKLKRTEIGQIKLGNLEEGRWRELLPEERGIWNQKSEIRIQNSE